MNPYTTFDYLCNEPYFLNGIGTVRCPTLRDIRRTTYQLFSFYLNLLTITPQDYQKLCGITATENTSLYQLLLYGTPQLLTGLLSFFLTDSFSFDKASGSFLIYTQDNTQSKQPVGHIGNDNFDALREELLAILGLRRPADQTPRFKNNSAKKLFEKMQKHSQKQNKKQDENYTLENMILKYCTHNKSGINILNVWDMTYYQFITMFGEYCNGRQCDFNDMMAANTFSYKNSTDYKPLNYMQKLNSNY